MGGKNSKGIKRDCRPALSLQNCFASLSGAVLFSFASIRLPRRVIVDLMDVSGTIDAILAKKGGEIFSIWPDATVFEAIELMDKKNVGALPVMQANQLVGMISERDYTRKVVLRGKRSKEIKVSDIMSTEVTTARPQESVEECLRLMTEKHFRHLPVLEGDKFVGIVSIGDLVKWIIASQSAAIAHLENYIHGGFSG